MVRRPRPASNGMDKVIKVYKKCGETPLDCINNLKNSDEELRFLPMTYAGRLDPLAEGLLLILVGDECLKKDEYLALSKEYEVEVLFGFATDTYDVLGKVVNTGDLSGELFKMVWPSSLKNSARRSEDLLNSFTDEVPSITISNTSVDSVLNEAIFSFVGRINQSYPPYSSRTVDGKPLWQWAREGKLDEIEIPTRDVYVESIDILETSEINGEKLLENIKEKISSVRGDFRQKEILSIWENNLKGKDEEKYPIIKLQISCGSGVYVRGIADELGKKLGIPALALSIKRTKIGGYINENLK